MDLASYAPGEGAYMYTILLDVHCNLLMEMPIEEALIYKTVLLD